MRPHYLLIFFLFFSCQTNTANKPTKVDSTSDLIGSIHPIIQLAVQNEIGDSIYKVGDYLFVGDKNLAFDFFQNGHTPRQLKSNGDHFYSDSSYTILADFNKVEG